MWEKITSKLPSPEPFYRVGAKVLAHCMYRLRPSGLEHIPETGPVLLIANHVSYIDGLVLHTVCKRPVRFVIDEGIYNVPAVKYWMEYCRGIPINTTRAGVTRALDEVSQALKDGDVVCIFPEGRLSYTGKMARFRLGLEWILQRDPVPVVPIALKGIWGSMFSRAHAGKKWRWFPKKFRRKIHILCGQPIPPEKAKINYLQRQLMRMWNMADE